MSVSSKSRSHGKLHPSGHAQLSRVTDPPKRGRRTTQYDAASSILSSQQTTSYRGKVQLQNTYRIKPEVTFSSVCSKVTQIMYGVLESFLADCEYEPNRCAKLAGDLATLIKKRVQELHLPRYKLVCNVIIGEDQEQGMQAASRYLWNSDTDSFASTSYQNGPLFAVATLYAVYFE